MNFVLSGFFTGLALIVAIGAQNAFVLRQGIKREHVLLVVAICALSDALLIQLGVRGAAWLFTGTVLLVARFGGAALLLGYAALALRRAWNPKSLDAGALEPKRPPMAIALLTLGFTWLNPHVYLDTVVLLGTVSAERAPQHPQLFALGASVASIGWFTSLGFGARWLAPLFKKRSAWRVLDALIAVELAVTGLLLITH